MGMKACRRTSETIGMVLLVFVLLAITVSGSASDDIAALPRQTSGFSQAFRNAPAAWGDDALGTYGCPDTIATTGCLVTAFACVLEYYGIEVELPASGGRISGSDPGALNAWLKEHGGYGRCAGDGYGNCCLEWSHLPSPLVLRTYYNSSETGIDQRARSRIDSALAQGQPVIAGVHWGQPCGVAPDRSEDCHWVVITAQAYGTYVILDPYNEDSSSSVAVRTTLDRGVHGNYIIDRYVIVDAPAYSPRATSVTVSLAPGPGSSPTDLSQMVIQTANLAIGAELFIEATNPNGTRWSILPGTPISEGRWIQTVTPTGVWLEPHELRLWSVPLPEGIDPTRWIWKAWLNDPLLVGVPLAQDTQSTTTAISASASAVGVLAAIALLAATISLAIWALTGSR